MAVIGVGGKKALPAAKTVDVRGFFHAVEVKAEPEVPVGLQRLQEVDAVGGRLGFPAVRGRFVVEN